MAAGKRLYREGACGKRTGTQHQKKGGGGDGRVAATAASGQRQAAAVVQAATRGKQAREEVAALRARAEATASITLMLKRKNRQFGIGVSDDNCVQEVDEGSGAAAAVQ